MNKNRKISKVKLINKYIHINSMETITISKSEYKRLKAIEKVEWEIVEDFKQGLKELKEGKVIEC